MVSVERLLLFLMSEGRAENAPKSLREATKTALRDLQTMEQDASFEAQKVQFLLDSTLGRINLVQNDIIKLFFGDRGHLHAPDRRRLDLWHELQRDAGARLAMGLSLAITLMAFAAIGPYVLIRWKKWL